METDNGMDLPLPIQHTDCVNDNYLYYPAKGRNTPKRQRTPTSTCVYYTDLDPSFKSVSHYEEDTPGNSIIDLCSGCQLSFLPKDVDSLRDNETITLTMAPNSLSRQLTQNRDMLHKNVVT